MNLYETRRGREGGSDNREVEDRGAESGCDSTRRVVAITLIAALIDRHSPASRRYRARATPPFFRPSNARLIQLRVNPETGLLLERGGGSHLAKKIVLFSGYRRHGDERVKFSIVQ